MNSLSDALSGLDIPLHIRDSLCIIEVPYISLENISQIGQLVIHKNVVGEVRDIFAEIAASGFPIAKMRPISEYGWDDETSMRDNNTSAFNYRVVYGKDILSKHSHGLAIDINPLFNPSTAVDGTLQPATGVYDPLRPGTILPDSEVVRSFTSRGWRWLGHRERKDWQHFDKADAA